jgi:hypothetical protein
VLAVSDADLENEVQSLMSTSVLVSTFLATTIEVIEMVAIVVAVGVTRSWRVALLGAAAGLVLLAVVVGVLGTALQGVPLKPVRLVVGALLLAFGSQWLRKGILLVSRDGWATGIGEESVDLYIVHWPKGGPTWTWPGMERAHELGYARSIGVSNFDAAGLQQVVATASIAPVVNQVQFSPYEYRKGLLDACRADGIVLEAYSPLGHGRHIGSETATRIAQRLGRTPAQVLLRWCIERDVPLIAKSTHRERIAENAQIFDFTLSNADMAELDALDYTGGTQRALERQGW